MRIDTIKIENFRLFKEQEFNFQPQFNLIIGQNGSGKTSLLEALAVALGGWAHAYIKSDTNLRPIQDKEIREIQLQNRFDKADYSTITAEGETTVIDRNADKRRVFASWERYMTYSFENTTTSGKIKYGCYPVEYNLNFSTLRGDILNYIEKEELFELPIIAFYKCDRLWLSQDVNREIAMQTKYSRFDPYIDCFHIGLNNEQLVTWIIKNELASIQQGKITPVLESIRKAAQCALENCTSIRFDIKESRILVDFDNKPSIPFEHLSDGQRTLLSLFCDLARRAEILNPHLEGNASAKTEGVVLIDELDLHLHPKWQRNIIENLRKAFPNIQFICTTHSPFLIQSLRCGEELIMLEGQPTAQLDNKSLEDIARGIMGVDNPQVAERYNEMKNVAKHYLETLEEAAISPEEKLELFKQRLADSIAPYADNPAFQAFLEMKRAVKLGE